MAECLNDCTDRCESFSHERTCNCQEYTSPSLTITKIGVALHVKFLNRDGSSTFIDCDINIPTIPTCTEYDGDILKVQAYLARVHPVGWLEEQSKLDNMLSAGNSLNLIGEDSWQVKMRMINRDLVLPRQVIEQKTLTSFPRAFSSFKTELYVARSSVFMSWSRF